MTASILSLLVTVISKYAFVIRIENLYTMIRAYLRNNYFLDVCYNETLQKYSYTINQADLRVIGWDNARYHVNVSSHLHHFHSIDGIIMESQLSENLLQDIKLVMSQLKDELNL